MRRISHKHMFSRRLTPALSYTVIIGSFLAFVVSIMSMTHTQDIVSIDTMVVTSSVTDQSQVLAAGSPSCVAYGVDDIDAFDTQFFSVDLAGDKIAKKLTGVFEDLNIESLEFDPNSNLFYGGSGGKKTSNSGLYVIPSDFSDIQKVYDPEKDDRITGLAYRPSNRTLYGWSTTSGSRGLIEYSKTGTTYQGIAVFDSPTLVMSDSKMAAIAWYDDYLYTLSDTGAWYKGNKKGIPTDLDRQPDLPGLPSSLNRAEGLEISADGVMLVGTETSSQTVSLVAYDITGSSPVVIEEFFIASGTVEDTEGLAWPESCIVPGSGSSTPSPTPTDASTPTPTATPTPSTTLTPTPTTTQAPTPTPIATNTIAPTPTPSPAGYNFYCPL
jgi:hypothetical protein